MDGYKIVYQEPDGAVKDTFFGEPMSNFSLPNLSNNLSNMDIIIFTFSMAYPDCDILSIERCNSKEFMK